MVKEIFLKYLGQFEFFLTKLGYDKLDTKSILTESYEESFEVEYLGVNFNRRLDIGYTVWKDGEINISLFLYNIHSKGTFFSLSNFIKNHGLQNKIIYKLAFGEDFEVFIKKYFEDLESLFKDELNDQITGKSFENHMDILNKSWNEHRDIIYEMEKSVVEEYKKKRDD